MKQDISQAIRDGIAKAISFISSRRIQFFVLVGGFMTVVGVLGLPGNQQQDIVAQLAATTDVTVEWLIVTQRLVTQVTALVSVLALAVQTLYTLYKRPIAQGDHLPRLPKDFEG